MNQRIATISIGAFELHSADLKVRKDSRNSNILVNFFLDVMYSRSAECFPLLLSIDLHSLATVD